MNPLVTLTSVFSLFGQGRSPAALLNFTAPRSGYSIVRDIAYGSGSRQRLDLYLPGAPHAGAPVLVFFTAARFVPAAKVNTAFSAKLSRAVE